MERIPFFLGTYFSDLLQELDPRCCVKGFVNRNALCKYVISVALGILMLLNELMAYMTSE